MLAPEEDLAEVAEVPAVADDPVVGRLEPGEQRGLHGAGHGGQHGVERAPGSRAGRAGAAAACASSARGVSPTASITTRVIGPPQLRVRRGGRASRPARRRGPRRARRRRPARRAARPTCRSPPRRWRVRGAGPARERARASRASSSCVVCSAAWTGTWKCTRHSSRGGQPARQRLGQVVGAARRAPPTHSRVWCRKRGSANSVQERAPLVDSGRGHAQRARDLRLDHAARRRRRAARAPSSASSNCTARWQASRHSPIQLGREPGEERPPPARRSRSCSRARAPARAGSACRCRRAARRGRRRPPRARAARRRRRRPSHSVRQPSGSVEIEPSSTSSGSSSASSRARPSV